MNVRYLIWRSSDGLVSLSVRVNRDLIDYLYSNQSIHPRAAEKCILI